MTKIQKYDENIYPTAVYVKSFKPREPKWLPYILSTGATFLLRKPHKKFL